MTDINTPAENFGSAIGSKHWIVDPTDSNQLQPIGAVGEIITEGPIVARGYHGKPIGADDGFVGPRSWSPWTGSSSNRYFKTGDLGRYNRDGSISFVARKDNQVKVRGQRMELQDVEHQLSRMPQVRHSTVTFPDAGPYAKQLVATVVLATDASSQEHGGTFSMLDPSERHIQSVHEIQDGLASSLPMYMVPTVWVMLQDLPRTVNGKLDRVRIKQWLNQVPDDVVEMVSRYMQADEADQPATEIEKKIQQTWADVLNLPHRYISNSSSFLRLGGDSIAAMTVLTRCRQLNVFVTVQDILRSKSLAQLAACATHYLEPTIEQQEELDTPFALSPMQKMHFNRTRNGIERFNQGFFLKLQRHVSLERVDEALQDIVMLHSALRTRFQKTESGHWSQYTPSHTEDNFALIEEYVSTQGECEGVASRVESQIDIVKGPIMAAALVNSKGQDHSQYLLISAHHLVVDLVSWRIILGDLEELLEKGKVNSHRSTSFQTWLSRHQQHVTEARTAVPTRGNCTPTDYAYWGLTEGENVYGDAKEESFALSHDQTATLLNKCHDAIGTEPIDILLTAVLFAFRQTFADRTEWPTVWNEGHGREPWDASMDLTRTVGWFTSIFPISVANDTPRDVISVLRRAKDARRAFSGSKGASYFAAQFAGDPNADESDLFRLPEIIFNYAGAYQQLEKEDGLFVNAGDINLHEVDMNLQRFSLFNVEMVVKNGQLHCTLVYHRRIKQVDQISDLLANCKLGLERQIEMLPTHPKLPTLSDFSSHDLRYEDLDYLVSRTLPELGVPGVADVEDYVPCSPMQNYMMNIERRIPGFINTYFYYEIIPGDGNRVDFSRLRRAWQTVVDRNPILRTIFVRNKDGERMQVILKHLPAPIERISGDTLAVLEDLNKSSPVPYEDNRVHYKVQYLETADGRGFCHLNISHALSDASSRPPLFEELSAAYDDRTRTSLPRSYVAAALEIESLHPYSFDFWKEYVANVPSCHLPVSVDRMQPPLAHQEIIVSTPPYADLLERCASEGVTMNNLLHAAWALLLRHATKNPKVCFNHLTAGRDARIPDIATVIGPCFNILLAKADIPASGSLGQVLHDAREDFLETLPHNGLPIAALEKGHSDHIEDMCNTSINFRKFVDQDEAKVLSPRQTEIRSIGQRGQVAVRNMLWAQFAP